MADRRYRTPEELAYLRKVYPTGVPVKEIANKLGIRPEDVYYAVSYYHIERRRSYQPTRIEWSAKEIRFIRKNFFQMTNAELAKALKKKRTKVREKCYELGLKRMEMEYWTPEQVQFMKDNYRTMGDTEIASILQERWTKKKGWSKKHVEKKRRYLGIKRTVAEEFQIRTGRYDAKDYKDFNGKMFPQGKKRLWFQNGKYRWMIKVGNEFVHYHRYKWEKHRGPIPKNKKLHFIDGDTTNCKLSNLVLLTKAALARRISNKNHSELSDSYIAGLLSWRSPDMKKHIINHPGIIDAKRKQIINNRKMGHHRCKKGSPAISKLKKQTT
jgi:hypothetical protein